MPTISTFYGIFIRMFFYDTAGTRPRTFTRNIRAMCVSIQYPKVIFLQDSYLRRNTSW